jgi:RNA polymerase sigma-70 factor (ECF subfamily)
MKRIPVLNGNPAHTAAWETNDRGQHLPQSPDTQTFEDVYEMYAEKVLNLAYRLTADAETARDLCQDVFIKVYQNLEGFDHKSHIYTWIYRIAVNHIANYLKKERRHRWVHLMDKKVSDIVKEADIDPAFWGRSTTPSPEHNLEISQRANIVWAAIRSLPARYRIPLVLHHYEGMSYQDIADAMKLSMSAVESRIHRAKKRLIKALEPWLGRV